ncbi:hypothetical protein BZG36_03140 [Bifiguratus adelaidae]|uniref:Proline-rich protein PRCC n=1 Tax=Bifiguratus adelaidae TaxID=1938954 RepID=A0A261XXC6_9FUNG|nr:hypothetical protein BZG36_03140 [Bifiguratus adelaidae]
MSLVDYGSDSDTSEGELPTRTKVNDVKIQTKDTLDANKQNLSKPGKVRISVRNATAFSNEDVEEKPKEAPSAPLKSGGLFAMLPKPKNSGATKQPPTELSTQKSTIFKPYSLAKREKPAAQPSPKDEKALDAPIPRATATTVTSDTEEEEVKPTDTEEDASTAPTNYFPLGPDVLKPAESAPEDTPAPLYQRTKVKSAPETVYTAADAYAYNPNGYYHQAMYYDPSQEGYEQPHVSGQTGVDYEALQALGGTKRKRDGPPDVNIVDVNQKDFIMDRSLRPAGIDTWTPAMPAPQFNSRKKHSLQSLLQDAQMRKEALEETFAADRVNKRQSRAKYGF